MTKNIPKVRVLIVEDDLRISELHKRFVEKNDNFMVIGIANTISDAEEMIEILEPDLLLLDLFFPVGNGLDLLHKVRKRKSQCDIILITAAREIASLQEAIRGGVFDYIVKPLFLHRFQEAMQKYHDYFTKIQLGSRIDQNEIDKLFHPRRESEEQKNTMPKGIDSLTLEKVQNVFNEDTEENYNADEVGRVIGVSRSTARRYLEHLSSEGFLQADLIYGAVGRPERRYFLKK